MDYKKTYDYDAILDATKMGSSMDQKIDKLIKDLETLDKKIEECEQSFHGKGTKSIYKAYCALVSAIGCYLTNGGYGEVIISSGNGMFYQVGTAINLCQIMYKNAERQKALDELNSRI